MERIKNLNRYQLGILLLLILMLVVFGVIYSVCSSRAGFRYHNVILEPSELNGNTIYSGTIQGEDAAFTVTEDKTVTFRYGEMVYGPYRAKEDPAAKPDDAEYWTGVEILEGNSVFFRGGVWLSSDGLILVDEDGGIIFDIIAYTSDGTTFDSDGNIVDPVKPSAATILELMSEPELTSKGEWGAWFGAGILSVLIAFSVLYADEIFRWNLAFQIRNVDYAEPSEWEIAGRYVSWTVMTGMTLYIYIMGLQ